MLLTAGLFAFVDAYAERAADSAYDQLLQAAALSIADTVRVEGDQIAVDLPYSSQHSGDGAARPHLLPN